jgi:hypothetical protein
MTAAAIVTMSAMTVTTAAVAVAADATARGIAIKPVTVTAM